jgi:hypothetical protein
VKNIVLLAVLLYGTSYSMAATVDDPDRKRLMTCSSWYNSWSENQKVSFLLGWLEGVQAADKMTGDVILDRLWPKGHRVGSVKLELDVKCERMENFPKYFSDVLLQIIRELNSN